MGFQLSRTIYNITFGDDHHLHGLEVTVTADSVAAWFGVTEYLEAAAAGAVSRQTIREVASLFGESLLAWNLENRGRPVLTTSAALLSQPDRLVFPLLRQWAALVQEYNLPTSDAPAVPAEPGFDESQIPMAPLETETSDVEEADADS